MDLNVFEVITIEQSFGENNIALMVTLDFERIQNRYGIIYGVLLTSVSEQIKIEVSGHASVQLTMSYNSMYNLSFFAMLCAYEMHSDPIHLFYGELSFNIYIRPYQLDLCFSDKLILTFDLGGGSGKKKIN